MILPEFSHFPSNLGLLTHLLHLHHGKLRPHHPHHGGHPGHVRRGHGGAAERGVLAIGDGAVDVTARGRQVHGLLAIALTKTPQFSVENGIWLDFVGG